MILADTNIPSTFAKIQRLPLLFQFFANDRIGVVPAVYEEFRRGVSQGYSVLTSVIELVQEKEIELVAPTADEVLAKNALAASFDSGERETMAVARSRGFQIMTNETRSRTGANDRASATAIFRASYVLSGKPIFSAEKKFAAW